MCGIADSYPQVEAVIGCNKRYTFRYSRGRQERGAGTGNRETFLASLARNPPRILRTDGEQQSGSASF